MASLCMLNSVIVFVVMSLPDTSLGGGKASPKAVAPFRESSPLDCEPQYVTYTWNKPQSNIYCTSGMEGNVQDLRQFNYCEQFAEEELTIETATHHSIGLTHFPLEPFPRCSQQFNKGFKSYCYLYFPFLKKDYFREKRGRETSICEREALVNCLLHTPLLGPACNPGMCPNRELNQRPFALQEKAPPTEPYQSGYFPFSFPGQL